MEQKIKQSRDNNMLIFIWFNPVISSPFKEEYFVKKSTTRLSKICSHCIFEQRNLRIKDADEMYVSKAG